MEYLDAAAFPFPFCCFISFKNVEISSLFSCNFKMESSCNALLS